jgi:2'-5' RNA ligase
VSDRLFFALWPDEALRQELGHRLPPLTAQVEGRPQRPDQWHVTLEFLGAVASDRQPAVWAAADAVALEPLELTFDTIDLWRKPQVYCLVSTRPPPAVTRFVSSLRAALAREGFIPEARDYRPHVTLARKVRAAPRGALTPPLAWPADRFALVRSVTSAAGSRYEPLRWWNATRRRS